MIESHHNQLKSFYLGKKLRNTRIDRVIYVLSQIIELDYRQDTLQTFLGLKKVYFSVMDLAKKKQAFNLPTDVAMSMVKANGEEAEVKVR